MQIIKIQALRGPNLWSIRRTKLIQMRLDLEELEERPTDKIEGFRERIEELLPTLIEHRCSEGCHGGFFQRVDHGTWMGHVIEHIALEIQTLAGMDVGFGRTRETKTPGVYNVVFNYLEEKVGVYAAKASVRIAEALIAGEKYDLTDDIQKMKEIREDVRLGPSTGSIVEEAVSRGIPYLRLGRSSLIQLGAGVNQMRFQATITCKTSNIAVDIACNKEQTKKLLNDASVPVAKGDICYDEEDLQETIDDIGYPIVIKPLDGNHGKGASINVTNWDDAVKGLKHAKEYSRRVIVEKFITGFDFRVLVINNEVIAAAQRVPAHVIGNGKHTIQEYVQIYEKLKKINPKIEFSSDFIIGYPEEDEQDFKMTMELIEKIKFINSYSFIFSPRPGTVAADLKLVDHKKSKQRLEVIQEKLFNNQIQKNKSLENKILNVLVENKMKDGIKLFGRTEYMTSVIFDGNIENIGKIVQVEITSSNQNSLFGKLTESSKKKVA